MTPIVPLAHLRDVDVVEIHVQRRGEELTQLRAKNNVRLRQAAKATGLSAENIADLELGRKTLDRPSDWAAIMHAISEA